MQKDKAKSPEFEVSTGNVYADLGLSDPSGRQVKAGLMRAINKEIKHLGLTQVQAAERVGLSQPDISNIAQGHGVPFSKDRLMDVLSKLGVDVEINLHHGTGRVILHELV
jgi:predicted XRE-type DNA-binding protein